MNIKPPCGYQFATKIDRGESKITHRLCNGRKESMENASSLK